jgi:hypothetical protein
MVATISDWEHLFGVRWRNVRWLAEAQNPHGPSPRPSHLLTKQRLIGWGTQFERHAMPARRGKGPERESSGV